MREMREHAEQEYRRWLENTEDDSSMHAELLKLMGNDDEIFDAFYQDLSFGTSGLRGILGPGTNRMNVYVVRRASQGIANYLKKHYDSPSVVIAYDTRKDSELFARETAAVFRGNKVKTHLFGEVTPVSVLAFAIRQLKCSMGVMITASHNPKHYNGYKVYNSDGYQVIGQEPEMILEEIGKVDFFEGIHRKLDNGVMTVSTRVSEDFIRAALKRPPHISPEAVNQLKTVYTPLHGTGLKYVRSLFKNVGYSNYTVVRSQEYPDPAFHTCSTPNPEKILTYDEAFKVIDREGGELIVATDPDADRCGAALYHDGVRTIVTGNQLGLLMLDYLCHMEPPEPDQIVAKSIVTSPLVNQMARKYGFKVVNNVPGFRYIGNILARLDQAGQGNRFYLGFEESNSFLVNPFSHEKDGITAAMLIVEIAAFHKAQGKDLIDRLNEIYEEFGRCVDKQRNYFFSGAGGRRTMDQIMTYLRREVRTRLGDKEVIRKVDYLRDTGLPKADALEFDFHDGSRLIIRPSGTEAKLKVYSFETDDFKSVERDMVRIIERFSQV